MLPESAPMVHLYTPRSEIELLLLRSLLDGAGIRHHVRNEAFAVGPQLALANGKSLYVLEGQFEEAITLLREFQRRTAGVSPAPAAAHTSRDRLRDLLSFLTLGWFGAPRRPDGQSELRLIKNDRPVPSAPSRGRKPLRLV